MITASPLSQTHKAHLASFIRAVAVPAIVVFTLTYIGSLIKFLWTRKSADPDKTAPTIPHSLPWLCHAFLLEWSMASFLKTTVKRWGYSTPLKVQAGTFQFTMVTNPSHIRSILRSSRILTNRPMMMFVMRKWFYTPLESMHHYAAHESAAAGSQNEHLHDLQASISIRFLSGQSLLAMSERYLAILKRRLARVEIPQKGELVIEDFFTWLQSQVTPSVIEAMLGSRILEMYPYNWPKTSILAGIFLADMEKKTLQRLAFQPFALSAEEDFKRYDSGKVRVFDEIEDNLQLNTALQALMVFNLAMIHGVDIAHRRLLNYDANKWVCTLFNVRTFTNKDVQGEPALKGVHSDGVDHTMTTYLGSNNMTPSSAVTCMHEMEETTGIQIHETKTHHVRARAHHRHFLDSLISVDHEYKHSLTPVFAEDPAKEATRDMLVFFTRRPVCEGHISSSIDSLNQHERLRMEFLIFAPAL